MLKNFMRYICYVPPSKSILVKRNIFCSSSISNFNENWKTIYPHTNINIERNTMPFILYKNKKLNINIFRYLVGDVKTFIAVSLQPKSLFVVEFYNLKMDLSIYKENRDFFVKQKLYMKETGDNPNTLFHLYEFSKDNDGIMPTIENLYNSIESFEKNMD